MIQKPVPPALPDFRDPRSLSDFQAQYYPSANGRAAPLLNAGGRNARIMLEFLAVYYDLNCAYAALLAARQQQDSPIRVQAEAAWLQAIEKILVVRDHLDDYYAPCGVIAEPLIDKGFTIDVRFSFGNVNALGLPRPEFLRITACVPIPLPPGTQLRDLPLKIEGPLMPWEPSSPLSGDSCKS